MLDPHAEYSRRLDACQKASSRQERFHILAGNLKLLTIVAGLILVWLSVGKRFFEPVWLLLPIAVYFSLVILHEKVLHKKTRWDSTAAFYRRGLARLDDSWAAEGSASERFRETAHVYAEDLDLFGKACLFDLLSTARLPMGQNRLAEWLAAPSDVATIGTRHALIAELRAKIDLRESLAIIGDKLRVRLAPESLMQWSNSGPDLPLSYSHILAVFLSLCAAGAFLYYLTAWTVWPLLLVLAIEFAVRRRFQQRAANCLDGMACNAEGLYLFSQIVQRLEEEKFISPHLQEQVRIFFGGSGRASSALRRLSRIVFWADSRHNLLARLMELPFLYTIQTGLAAERWRHQYGARVPEWIEGVSEMEAILSLASYSYEHPADPFPEIATLGDAGAIFDGEDLGHPLLPASQCVRNSVRLDSQSRVLLISGSNMSGKSTLLRVVGINAVLAMCGAPIRGKSLRLTPLSLGACIRRSDSLQEGRSTFYTEILRIRSIFDLTKGNLPLLFLFDELLEGTNSKDRRIGAESLIAGLLRARAVGLVTTHDLALTELADHFAGLVRNLHFQDFVENGKMRFDYKLREGVVGKSNAVELMRLIGLEV